MPRLTTQARRALTEERRAQILAAAARVFARKGFAAATMSAVAKEAGVAPGSIYNYFKSKSDLLVSIPRTFVQPAIQPLNAQINLPAVAAHVAPEQVLNLLAHNMVGVVHQNADLIRVFISSLPSMTRSTRAKYFEQVPQFALGILETYIGQQMDDGVFRADLNPAIVARMIPGMLMIFMLLQEIVPLEDIARFDYDEIVAAVVQVFLHGVSADEPDTPPAPRARKTARKQSR